MTTTSGVIRGDRLRLFRTRDELGADALGRLVANPELWRAAAAWRDHIAGPPRIAEDVYSWARRSEPDELSYLPTPGAGDSDGGDIF